MSGGSAAPGPNAAVTSAGTPPSSRVPPQPCEPASVTDIRDALATDAAAIAAVQVASWQAAYRTLLPDEVLNELSVGDRTERWAEILREPPPRSSLLLATVDTVIVGFAAVGDGELHAFYVHPDHWREGVGTRLHQAATDRLGLVGCTAATLWVLEGNERALGFYGRVGWVDTGQRKVDVGPGGVPLAERQLRYSEALRPAFVPIDYSVPSGLTHPAFRLEPLGPEHNDSDLAAWGGSIPHIRHTPGFRGRSWPPESGMSLEANLADLRQHAADFVRRTGFTYTVLDPTTGDVIGCVYLYPARTTGVDVRSWVRADRGELDPVLHRTVTDWLRTSWPFEPVAYAPRPD